MPGIVAHLCDLSGREGGESLGLAGQSLSRNTRVHIAQLQYNYLERQIPRLKISHRRKRRRRKKRRRNRRRRKNTRKKKKEILLDVGLSASPQGYPPFLRNTSRKQNIAARAKAESLLGNTGAVLVSLLVLTVFILERPLSDWHPICQIQKLY